VPSSSLKSLVESYIVNKQKEDDFKKKASAENTQIKELMHEYNLTEVSTDLGTAKITEQEKVTFIEEKLIEFLKTNNVANDIVKTKEYVDFDALESAIYNEKIPAELIKEMSSCQEKKITTVLRISKKKGD
jgi:hypothetical protein